MAGSSRGWNAGCNPALALRRLRRDAVHGPNKLRRERSNLRFCIKFFSAGPEDSQDAGYIGDIHEDVCDNRGRVHDVDSLRNSAAGLSPDRRQRLMPPSFGLHSRDEAGFGAIEGQWRTTDGPRDLTIM